MSNGVEACQAGGQRICALRAPDGPFLTAEVSTQAWNQRVKATTDWSQGVAALSGTMGPRTENGVALATPDLQVFGRKPKAPTEAVAPPAEVRSAAVTAANPVEVTAVTTAPDPTEPVPVPPTTAVATVAPDLASRKPRWSLKHRQAPS